PRLDARRPQFAARAAQSRRLRLEPLSPSHCRQLAAALLARAERVPAAVLDRLAALAGGNPGRMNLLIAELERSGAVREHPETGRWLVAAEGLDRLPAETGEVWAASARLRELPPGLAELLRVCSIF